MEVVDAVFARFPARHAPGIAYGVVRDGALVHAGACGTVAVGQDHRPDAESVYRIASMTKSFVAATILVLRDAGALRLDDPVAAHLPAAIGLRGPTDDAPPITLRDLLAMSSGLTTDDPWADRLEDLSPAAFDDLLRAGGTFAHAPGTTFEYSNYGFAILGAVITAVGGRPFWDVIGDLVLDPLGLDATTFRNREVPAGRRVPGYHAEEDGWVVQPDQDRGAFSAIGGLSSSVADLARWVAFLADAWPPRDGAGVGPLSRASRREMQRITTTFPLAVVPLADGRLIPQAGGYCLGLVATDDLETGTIVSHSGGYPGFGSHMCFHPATGIGVIALANGRYAPARLPANEALRALVAAEAGPAARRVHPALLRGAAAARRLVESWDDDAAVAALAPNALLDESLDDRRTVLARLREEHGPFTADGPLEADGQTVGTLRLGGRGADLLVEVALTAEAEPRLQRFDVTAVPEPSGPLVALARSEAARRTVAAAEALLGPLRLERAIAGDGTTTATFALDGASLGAALVVTLPEDVRVEPVDPSSAIAQEARYLEDVDG